MLFKEKENQIKYLIYETTETHKQRHFTLRTDILEYINELIAVFNHNNPNLNLTSSLLANIIFNNFFKEFENLTDQEKLNLIKKEVLKEL